MFDLREQVASTGIYRDDDPVSDGEMAAYERQLEDLLAWQQQMKLELSIATAVLLLPRWEKIYKVVPKPTDSILDRQVNLMKKRRAKGALTPAKVIAFVKDFGYTATVTKRVRPYRYRIDLETINADLRIFDQIITNAEPGHQAHEYGLTAPDEIMTIQEIITVNMKRYHTVGEFRVGMTPLKYQSEVTL